MNKKEQVRRRIIELIHGCEWHKAVRKDAGIEVSTYNPDTNRCEPSSEPDHIIDLLIANPKPITLGRLLKALDPYGNFGCIAGHIAMVYRADKTYKFLCPWLLTLPNGQEATLDDQSDETIEALFQLLITE